MRYACALRRPLFLLTVPRPTGHQVADPARIRAEAPPEQQCTDFGLANAAGCANTVGDFGEQGHPGPGEADHAVYNEGVSITAEAKEFLELGAFGVLARGLVRVDPGAASTPRETPSLCGSWTVLAAA